MARFKVGCVPYVNALPLVWWFEHQGQESPVEVTYNVPSQLPQLLQKDQVEAILVSSIDAIQTPNRAIAQGICIGSYGKVESVKIFSKVPFENIKTIALDSSSMTSNTLAQIILAEQFNVKPITKIHSPNPNKMLEENDACVLIGDIGMSTEIPNTEVLDLGEAWTNLTGLPFVWALWTGHPNLSPILVDHLNQSYNQSKINNQFNPSLIQQGCKQTGWSKQVVKDYLSNSIRFELDQAALDGFAKFKQLLATHKLIENAYTPNLIKAQSLSNHSQ